MLLNSTQCFKESQCHWPGTAAGMREMLMAADAEINQDAPDLQIASKMALEV